jgi:hypothetical protein
MNAAAIQNVNLAPMSVEEMVNVQGGETNANVSVSNRVPCISCTAATLGSGGATVILRLSH